MSIFFTNDYEKRKANLCHLLVAKVPDNELISNYGFAKKEIEDAHKILHTFDDNAYLHGKIKRAFKKRPK